MRIVIKKKNTENGQIETKTFIAKLRYDNTKTLCSQRKDEYKRDVLVLWRERVTSLSVYEWQDVRHVKSATVYSARTVCSYRDVYNKQLGRNIVWSDVLDEMSKAGLYSQEEVDFMKTFGMNATVVEIDLDTRKIDIKN